MSLRKTAASKYDSSLDSSLANEVADELVRPILNQNNLDDSMIIQALESLTAQYEDKQAKKASKKVSFDISSKIDGVSGNPDKVSAFIKELYAILASTGKAAFNIVSLYFLCSCMRLELQRHRKCCKSRYCFGRRPDRII